MARKKNTRRPEREKTRAEVIAERRAEKKKHWASQPAWRGPRPPPAHVDDEPPSRRRVNAIAARKKANEEAAKLAQQPAQDASPVMEHALEVGDAGE